MPISNHKRYQLTAWIPAFLRALSEGLCVREAARVAGTCPSTVYHHRQADEAFCACWNRAAERGTELLEQEAVRRAYHGVGRPVFYKGEQCGTIQEYSDPLLIFMLKARRPEMYRDMVEQGKGGVNVSVQANIAAVALLRKQLAG